MYPVAKSIPKKKLHAMKAVHVHPKQGPSRHRSRRHS
jgi:hypothetical protein